MKKRRPEKKENIWNVPNALTLSRIIITFITLYFIIADFHIIIILILFSIGMITDFLDGQIARRWKQVTEFGRKFDMIADRLLMAGVGIALILDLAFSGLMNRYYLIQIFMIFSREIISLPSAIIVMTSHMHIPKARFVGKLTTTLQGFTFPAIILSIYYSFFSFAIYLAIATCIVGIISGVSYIYDLDKIEEKLEGRRK